MKKYRKIIAGVCSAVMCFSAVSVPVSALELNPVETVQAQADNLQTRDVWCANEDVNRWESEHFQFIWGKNGADSSKITESFLQENAKNLEACWDVYMNDLKMEAPTQSVNLSLRDGNQYKVNFYISGTGLSPFADDWAYMGYDNQGYAFMFCCVGAMQNSPNPSWVLPHEFGHVVTAHQLGWNENKYVQSWWEAIANWYREQFLYSDYYSQWVTDPASGTDYFETYMKNLCFTPILGRDNYASWAFLQYLTDNPDNLDGYGKDFMKTLMQNGQRDEYPYKEIDRLANADIKETLGKYAARLATLDFNQQEKYQARQSQLLNSGEWNWGEIYTLLEKTTDKDNYYTVPTERAPQQFGLNIIPLKAYGGTWEDGASVSATLEGLTDVQGADWRACLVVAESNGNTRYSDLFKAGETASINVGVADAVFLVVTATPDSDTWQENGVPWAYSEGEFDENNRPFLGKTRYPYAVTIDGAEIRQTANNTGMAQGNYHSNGGGFVASTARVDDSVYVAPNAKVMGYATVTGNAQIKDYAIVTGSANVSGNAVISGHAVVAENATVKDNAIISDYAGVMGNSVISDNARVLESGLVFNNYNVSGNATVKGVSYGLAKGSATGQAITDGDYYDDSSRTLQAGAVYGWASPDAYANSRPYNDGQYAGLEFDTDSSRIAKDNYISTYGVSVNNPTWEETRTSGNGVLTFNGGNQYLIADSSYANFHDAEYQTAVLLRGDGTIFSFGNMESKKYMMLNALNGKLVFSINDGNGTQKLTAENVYELGKWITISIVLTGDEGKLLVNGQTVASGEITADPVDVVSEDANYCIGKGLVNGLDFKGSMDYFRVNFKEVAEPEYYYTESEEIKPLIMGDINADGIVNIYDLIFLKKAVLNGTYSQAGDFDYDGKNSVTDIIVLQKYLLNMKTKVQSSSSGAKTIYNAVNTTITDIESSSANNHTEMEEKIKNYFENIIS